MYICAKNCPKQGCQIFLGPNLKNIPNDHKQYETAIKYTKWTYHIQKGHKNSNIFNSKAHQNLAKLGVWVWKKTIWQPWPQVSAASSQFASAQSSCMPSAADPHRSQLISPLNRRRLEYAASLASAQTGASALWVGCDDADGDSAWFDRWDSTRVTRWVCEKSAQNVPSPTYFCQKLMHNFNRGKK
jgi:hypothetical protein